MLKTILRVSTFCTAVVHFATSAGVTARVDSIIETQAVKLLEDERFTSVSVGIVKGDVALSGHFGELTKGQGDRPNDKTIYEIGSVSKVFLGYLTALAVEDGKLQLDTNINQYFQKPLVKSGREQDFVTVRQLLTHTSGLPRGNEELGLSEDGLNTHLFIRALREMNDIPHQGSYHYSGVATELLAYLLETVYGTPFDLLLKQAMSEKAGMTDTQVNLSLNQMPFFAYGYDQKGRLAIAHTEQNKLWGGSGYVKSSMSDLLKFMRLQLQDSDRTVKRSHQKLFDVTDTDSLGYLWIVSEDQKLGRYLIHHGGVESTQNWLLVVPKQEMAVSVVTNSSFPETASILRQVVMNIAEELANHL